MNRLLQKVIKGLLPESVLIVIIANVNMPDGISHVLSCVFILLFEFSEGLLQCEALHNKSCTYLVA